MSEKMPMSKELVHEQSRRMLRWAEDTGLVTRRDRKNEWMWEPTPAGLAEFLGLLWERYAEALEQEEENK